MNIELKFENFPQNSSPKKSGRTEISFLESSSSGQWKKTNLLLQTNSPNRLMSAGHKLTKSNLGIDTKKLIDFMSDRDLSTPDVIEIIKSHQSIKFNSIHECLKLYLDMSLTKNQYQLLRNNVVDNGLGGYLCSYKKLQQEIS